MSKIMELNKKALGLSLGLLFAFWFFVAGLFATYTPWGKEFVELVGTIYIGYAPTLTGTLIGTVEIFIDGFIFGWLLAYFYNKFSS